MDSWNLFQIAHESFSVFLTGFVDNKCILFSNAMKAKVLDQSDYEKFPSNISSKSSKKNCQSGQFRLQL